MDLEQLENIIEKRRKQNQNFSLPFIVKSDSGRIYISWFSYEISRSENEDWMSYIDLIFILDSNEHINKYAVSMATSACFDIVPPALYCEYIPELKKIYANFSEEKMDSLFEEKAYKPLFNSYIKAKEFVQDRIN